MDFDCIEAILGLPEFRIIDQVIGPQRLDLHLEHRAENPKVYSFSTTSRHRLLK